MGRDQSIRIKRDATSTSVSISSTSAQSAALDLDNAVIWSTIDCFALVGSNPTAVAGTCTFFPGNTLLRADGWKPGEKIAFITASGTGTVYISPGA